MIDRGRRVVVGVDGSPGSLQALRQAVALAADLNATLCPVLAWTPPGGDLLDRRAPVPALRRIWAAAAERRLWDAFDAALGGVPATVAVRPHVVQGLAGPVLVALACEDGDVLVVGTGRRGWLRRLRHGSVTRHCLARARCPVLAVPPPDLLDEAAQLRRGLRWRRRLAPRAAAAPPLSTAARRR